MDILKQITLHNTLPDILGGGDYHLSETQYNNLSGYTGDFISGSGITNYITVFNSDKTLTNSNIYYDGVNVGIGTSSPETTLDVNGSTIIRGDLFVSGSATTIYTEELTVKDNLILINSGETGSGVTAGYAGIGVDRGNLSNFWFIFDESSDSFRIGESGLTQAVATREDFPIDTSLVFWNDSTNRLETNTDLFYSGNTLHVIGNVNISSGSTFNVDNNIILRYIEVGESLFIGKNSGLNQTGTHNTMIGVSAGENNTENFTLFMGEEAGKNNTGNLSTCLGYRAGKDNSGEAAISLGYQAGERNSGDSAISIGDFAGRDGNAEASINIGVEAGIGNLGVDSIVIGLSSGKYNEGDYTIFIGEEAGKNNTGGDTIGLGYGSGDGNTGEYNYFIGEYAGYANEGSNCVFIGEAAGESNTLDNQFILKQDSANSIPLIQGDFATGYVGIGTDSPSVKLDVVGSVSASTYYGDGSNLTGIEQDLNEFELLESWKSSHNNYIEFTEVSGNTTQIDYWSNSGKTLKLFTKTISYNINDEPTEIINTDEISSKILTTNIEYSGTTILNITKIYE